MFEITLAEQFEMAFAGRNPVQEATIGDITLRVVDRGLKGRFIVRPEVVEVAIDQDYGLGAIEDACHTAITFR